MKKRIGIFGGSFDPVHAGHMKAAGAFLKSKLIHELWIVPAPDPPHKRKRELTTFDHRFQMLELAFRDMRCVKVDDIESRLERPSYTFRTLEALQRKNRDCLFFLCLGEDSLVEFSSWYRYRAILGKTTLIVVRRPGSDAVRHPGSGLNRESGNDTGALPQEILEQVIFLENNPVDISSSEIRAGSSVDSTIPERVRHYIRRNGLYRKGPASSSD